MSGRSTHLVDNSRQEKRESVKGHVGTHIDEHCMDIRTSAVEGQKSNLTAKPGLPILQGLDNVLHPEVFSCSAELVVWLEAANDNSPFCLTQELGGVGEVLDDPERCNSCEDRGQTFQDCILGSIRSLGSKTIRNPLKIHAQAGLPPIPSMLEIAAYKKRQSPDLGQNWNGTDGKEATKGTRNSGCWEKHSGADTEFWSFVPAKISRLLI